MMFEVTLSAEVVDAQLTTGETALHIHSFLVVITSVMEHHVRDLLPQHTEPANSPEQVR